MLELDKHCTRSAAHRFDLRESATRISRRHRHRALAKESGVAPSRPSASESPNPLTDASSERASSLVCAHCGAFVTSREQRIEIDGEHAHTFVNPAGMIFRIGCFAVAPGVASVGEGSGDFTWFRGFVWQVALCRGCGEHLGWLFSSNAMRFFGLILDRLAESRAAPSD
ncbi:MAG TPA: cereblon family protein [Polyangiaceae bacterium]|nr:cereblon family protein [Polyangiaceae bacterium]